jgi:dUTP pyrophosphatase
MQTLKILIKKKKGFEDIPLPEYKSEGSSGMDIRAAVDEKIVLKSGEISLIPTGLFMAIPDGYEIQVRPRSGLALNHGISLVNTPGTIDSDYRGEISIIMINHSKKSFEINRGDRIAQLIVQKIEKCDFILSDNLPVTTRGSGGFGHTGH